MFVLNLLILILWSGIISFIFYKLGMEEPFVNSTESIMKKVNSVLQKKLQKSLTPTKWYFISSTTLIVLISVLSGFKI